MKIFSVDAETNGLYGQAFAIAAVVTDDSGEVARFVGRCPIEGEVADFVRTDVLPQMKDIEETHKDYDALLEDFWQFYMEHKKDAYIIASVPCPVEAKIFRDAVEKDLENRETEGPFPLIDVASALTPKGKDISALSYLSRYNLEINFEGDKHNPLFDCMVAELAYRHLMTGESTS